MTTDPSAARAILASKLHDQIYRNIQETSKTVNYGFVDTVNVVSLDPELVVTPNIALSRIKRYIRGQKNQLIFDDDVSVVIPSLADMLQRGETTQFRNKVTIEIRGMPGYSKSLKFKLFTTFRYHIPGLKCPGDMDIILHHIKAFLDTYSDILKFSIEYGDRTYKCMIKRNEAQLGTPRIVLQDFYSFLVNSGRVSGSKIIYSPIKGRGLVIYETRPFMPDMQKKYMSKGDTYRVSTTVHSTGSFSIKGIFKKTQRLEIWEMLAESMAGFIVSAFDT